MTKMTFFQRRHKDSKCRMLKTYGLSEAVIKEKLRSAAQRDVYFEILSHPKGVDLRVVVEGESEKALEEMVEAVEKRIRQRLGEHVFGLNGDKMETAVGKALLAQKKTIAVAESCTGGLICHWLTNVSGSSEYFKHGIIAYSNESKIAFLNVPGEILTTSGAVSSQTVEAMAKGIRQVGGTDIGLAVSGIAGPGGGTAEKPVGLVWIGLADNVKVISEEHHFRGARNLIKIQASQAALDLVRRNLGR